MTGKSDRILQSRDANIVIAKKKVECQETPVKHSSTHSTREEMIDITVPITSKKDAAREKFEEILKFRVAEDPDGDLADMGISEWSIDDFQHVQILGSGTAGKVYQVKEKLSGYELALKVQEYDEQDISADIELDIHSNLDHPNIVKMVDYFFSPRPFLDGLLSIDDKGNEESGPLVPDKLYFHMILEFCSGGSLFDVIESYPGGWLDESIAVRYFKGCMQGVQHLHEQGMIHCDIKTANFLVDAQDEIKLADFGMTVRSADRDVLGGSPVFMAPEHLQAWQSGGDDFDHRVDVYGLGVTLFQILVGDLPFHVIENDEDEENADSLLACFGKLAMNDGETGFDPPRLDLRGLDDIECKTAFVMPTITFPDRLSDEACDLIRGLMDPCRHSRLSITRALEHDWFCCSL